MPALVLTSLKILLIVLLYLFVARAVRVIYLDLVGPRTPKRRPQVPKPSAKPRVRPRSLVVTEGDSPSRTYPLADNQPMVFGRSDQCQVVLKDTYVSQVHTRVFQKEGNWYVEDVGSTNGTYLNRAKVTEATQVSPGDEVRLGKTRVEIRR